MGPARRLYDPAIAEQPSTRRPDAPTTRAEIERSLRVIRLAVAGGVASIVVLTVAFLTVLDAPAVPLVPVAAVAILIDLGFLIVFTRQRREALRRLEERR